MQPSLPVVQSHKERIDSAMSNGSIVSKHSIKCNGTGNNIKVVTADDLLKSNGHIR